jgi:hypothetical protein
MMGISKRELLEDYYPGELPALMWEWTLMHRTPDERVEELGEVDPQRFLEL